MHFSDIEILFKVAGGLSILLYGIHLLGANLQRILGFRLEEILKKTGANPIKGAAIGTAVTAAIQSSGTTATMLLGFISRGYLSLKNAMPVLLGASIGGTITIQLASLNLGVYAMPIIVIGFFIFSFFSNRVYRSFGKAAIGLGLLFVGMNYIFDGTSSFFHNPSSQFITDLLSFNYFFSIIFAALFTFLIQSSSASSVLIVALGSAGILSLETAITLIIGVNLGASLKIVFLAINRKTFSKSLALIHLMYNVFGLIVFTVFFKYYYFIIAATSENIAREIANAHTIYNLLNAIIFFPFSSYIVKITEKYAPFGSEMKISALDKRLIYTPSIALDQVNKTVVEMAAITYNMLENSKKMLFENKLDLIEDERMKESDIDEMTEKTSEYAMRILEQNLSKKDSMKLYSLMHILTDIEHSADHILVLSEKIVEFKKQGLKFSEKANRELMAIFGKLKMMQNLIIKSLQEDNLELANEIIKHENKVDEIIKKSLSNHVERIKNNVCSVKSGEYFVEFLNNLERIGDHSDNIAYAVVDRFRYK